MWFDDQSRRIIFESQKFAEGRFRNAYKGTWINPLEKQGQKCVIKEKKDTYTWNPTDWDTSVKIQKKAQELAGSFNRSSYQISFAEVDVLPVLKNDSPSGPRRGEHVLVEDFIPGNFKKWCSNYGFISDEAKTTAITMPAFMHWSWVHTGGEMMVADLQGVRGDDGYTLTDPVILSTTGTYGATDMGVEGMAMFFIHHECNGICSGLSRPFYHDVITRIPQPYRAICEQLLQQVMSSTTYTFELKFPPHIRATVLQTFREIARR